MDYMPGMRVPGLIYADEAMIDSMAGDMAIQQVANTATLAGHCGARARHAGHSLGLRLSHRRCGGDAR